MEILSLVYGLILFAIVAYVAIPFNKSDSLSVGSRVYRYKLGNNLEAEMVLTKKKFLYFHGIDIELPKTFPHMYLDAHKDSSWRGPRFKIDASQRISLEGGFDRYFALYAKPQYRILALSVITPDIMQVMMRSAERFDIEIKGRHLRLISQQRIFFSKRRRARILQAARAVLSEIDHKINSWNANQITNVHDTQLYVYANRVIRIGPLRIRLSFVWCLIIGLAMSGYWFYGMYPMVQEQRLPEAELWLICSGFLLLPFLVFGIFDIWERKSPETYWKYYGWWQK